MSIQTKIEEIRRQPEHIRMRYLVLSVGVSMFFIGFLWVFSLTTSFKQVRVPAPVVAVPNQAQDQEKKDAQPEAQQISPEESAPSLNEWIKK